MGDKVYKSVTVKFRIGNCSQSVDDHSQKSSECTLYMLLFNPSKSKLMCFNTESCHNTYLYSALFTLCSNELLKRHS